MDADGDVDRDALKLAETLDEGDGLLLGLIEWESEALGDRDDGPNPSGVVSGSLNLHAT